MFTLKDRQRCEELFDKYYKGRKFNDVLYRDLIKKYLIPGQRVLDAGCGRYLKVCKELSEIAEMVGIDLEPSLATDNRNPPYGICADVNKLPFPPASFDMVISRSVIEHLEDPALAFREFARVLRPGGHVVIVTPNKYDYVSVIAAITPYRLHRFLVSRIFRVPAADIFPTLYRANTIRSLSRVLQSAGLIPRELETVNHYPAYLMYSPVLFRLGVLYERLTAKRPLRSLRGSILCAFQKKGAPELNHRAQTADVHSAKLDGHPIEAR